ncbi:transcription factor bHLH51-like [Macadamia integrifolia]|uniref:transcription factor bHLH51-like n=1 Tax=Macadamia integrifolia TaxID=60698 RepID=UPI001C4EDBCC|nr:transcription factor bHLH51-like [Macadamia integrifolia]
MDKCFLPDWPKEARHHALNRGPFGSLEWPPLPPYASTSLHAYHSFPFSSLSAEAIKEDRATAASKSHSQAEKRRRERINAHLAHLRKLVPRSDKMDKATLLGSVIEHVKNLKIRAEETTQDFLVPTEVDEVTVDFEETDPEPMNSNINKGNISFKASICCEDRPDLFTDIIEALKDLKLTTVKSDIATVGGRVINVMTLSATRNYEEGTTSLKTLKKTIKVALTRVASSSSVTSMNVRSSKRQRTLLPSYHSQSHVDPYEALVCAASGSNSQSHTL